MKYAYVTFSTPGTLSGTITGKPTGYILFLRYVHSDANTLKNPTECAPFDFYGHLNIVECETE